MHENQVQGLLTRACSAEGRTPSPVTASLRVPLAAGRSLELLAVQGAAPALTSLAGRLSGIKGVLACELTLASPLASDSHTTTHEEAP